jgi:hypothetical protein
MMKSREMGRACKKHGDEEAEECIQGFGGKTKYLDLGEMIILKWILKK